MATQTAPIPAATTAPAKVIIPRDPSTGRTYFNRKSTEKIMQNRKTLEANLVGKKVHVTVTTAGTPFLVKRKADGEVVESIVEPGTPFEKMIYNTNANSSIAMANKTFWQIASDALKAENAGDYAKAHELYTQFLNKMQVSFSVPSTNPIINQLGIQVDIEARVQRVDTDNGSLLTLDPKTIRVLGPVELKDTTFSFDSIFGTAENVPADSGTKTPLEA